MMMQIFFNKQGHIIYLPYVSIFLNTAVASFWLLACQNHTNMIFVNRDHSSVQPKSFIAFTW